MDIDKIRARDFIEKRKSERESLVFSSQPIYSSLFADKRNIFSSIAIISATVGAFSFLLFNSNLVLSPSLLVIGDVSLLITIIVSLYFYIYLVRIDMVSFHKDIHDNFERLTKDIDKGYEVLNNTINFEDFKHWAINELERSTYQRPPDPDFSKHWMVLLFFTIALALVGLSFFISEKQLSNFLDSLILFIRSKQS